MYENSYIVLTYCMYKQDTYASKQLYAYIYTYTYRFVHACVFLYIYEWEKEENTDECEKSVWVTSRRKTIQEKFSHVQMCRPRRYKRMLRVKPFHKFGALHFKNESPFKRQRKLLQPKRSIPGITLKNKFKMVKNN